MTQAAEPSQERLSQELEQLLQRLSRTRLRHDDQPDQLELPAARKPVYLLLHDHERAERLAQQLEFFGLSAQPQPCANAFLASLAEQPPAAIVMDVDFTGPGAGLPLAALAQRGQAQPIPLLFFSLHDADTPTRLAAVRRRPGVLTGTLEASSLLEKLEAMTSHAQQDPLRVLIVDDSRAQALHTERVLASAGMLTRSLNDPIRAMVELADFQPDLIILDLYMPTCSGPNWPR